MSERRPGGTKKLPLEGVRIIDCSYVFSVPYAGGLLADLGAEVIKIEGPGRVDLTREWSLSTAFPDGDPGDDPWNRQSYYHALNRGKKSLVLDLSREEGRDVLRDLIGVSDVFMENFTPRVMRRWKLDYPNAKKLKPDLVMVTNTGYGYGDGPYSEYPAMATTQEATHGLAHITGYRDGMPSKAGQSYVDFLATWTALLGVALGLRYRHRTGNGLWVDAGMYQLGCYNTSEFILDWLANGRRGERIGNRHPWRAPQGCYRCAGDDEWCVVSVGDEDEWAALCRVIGRPDLAEDRRFETAAGRAEHHDQLDGAIESWTKGRDKTEAMERLQEASVPAGAVFDARDTNLDKHHRLRGFLETVDFPGEAGTGKRQIVGRPWRFNKTPLKIRGPAPKLGQHNREVLQGVLRYGDAKYDELEDAGIIADRPRNPVAPSTTSLDELVEKGVIAYHDPEYNEKLGQ